MRWVQSEYALKGLFLGLLLFTALQSPGWEVTGHIALAMLTGLGAGMVIGILRQIRGVPRMIRKPHAFLVFLLLENPLLIYTGVIGGLVFGIYSQLQPLPDKPNIVILSLAGAILGYGFGQLRDIKDSRFRLGLSIAVGAGVVYALVMWLEEFSGGDFLKDFDKRQMLAFHMLLGLPFYYLLCFAGMAEESEAEIAGLCTMLGFSIYLLKFPTNMPAAGFLLPLAIYFTYAVYVLPSLQVFKHTLRGYIYMDVGKLRPALLSFRRALQIDPANHLAHQGMDALHTNVEFDKVDAATLGLLDPSRCLNRTRVLLGQTPTSDQMKKAAHLLNLVEKLWPKLAAQVSYYRALAAVHAHEMDRASDLLNDLLSPEGWFPDDAARKAILFDAWQLVLLVHPVLKRRVGDPQLALPGRRMEAIGAVERQLVVQPAEPAILEFRQSLYADLQEREYAPSAQPEPPTDFSHVYAEELGMASIANPEQWRRGAEYLRMAAFGLPLRRPSIYLRLAEAYGKAGETLEATKYRQLVRDAGQEIGIENLPADQRAIYFTTVKKLGDEAAAREDFDEAIYNFSLSTHDPASGVPTLKGLAEMYEKKKDVMNALRITEKALCHNGRDENLLQKKDSYYYSLEPDKLAITAKEDDNVRKYFDVKYCVTKAKSLLDSRNSDLEVLEWAEHLMKLALVMQPKNLIALVQKSRVHLRRGERDEGLTILEDIRELKPSGTEESDAWYFVHKQLGKLYLDELNRADLAIPCFLEYVNHIGSGAETLYDLGRAYEATGEKANAINYYRMVTAYEGHRLVWDSEQAVRRLKGEG